MADNLPVEQVAGIKKMFHMMDTDNNGNLTFQELKDGLHLIGHPVPDPDVQMILDAVSVYQLESYLHRNFLAFFNNYFPDALFFSLAVQHSN